MPQLSTDIHVYNHLEHWRERNCLHTDAPALLMLTGCQPVCRQQLAADNPNTDTIRTLFIAAIISSSSLVSLIFLYSLLSLDFHSIWTTWTSTEPCDTDRCWYREKPQMQRSTFRYSESMLYHLNTNCNCSVLQLIIWLTVLRDPPPDKE